MPDDIPHDEWKQAKRRGERRAAIKREIGKDRVRLIHAAVTRDELSGPRPITLPYVSIIVCGLSVAGLMLSGCSTLPGPAPGTEAYVHPGSSGWTTNVTFRNRSPTYDPVLDPAWQGLRAVRDRTIP